MITIKLSGSLNKVSFTPLGTIQTRTSLSSWFRHRAYVFRVSPGERAPWIPPLWFSLMEKSRDVRGLGTYSFLGLPEDSLILQSGKRNLSTNKVNRKRILCVIVAKPANPGRREHWPFIDLAGELCEDLSRAAVVLQLRLHQSGQLTHLLDLRKRNTWMFSSERSYFH